MIRILHVLSALNGGGVESMLLSYYKYMDKDNIRFDFVVHGNEVGILEEKFSAMGSKIYHVVPKRENYLKNLRQIKDIIRKEDYDIIHCHQNCRGVETVVRARKAGVKTIIAHSHIAYVPENFLAKIHRFIMSRILIKNATHYVACSEDAARWLFSDKMAESGKAIIIRNAIQAEKFAFSSEMRKNMRKQLGVDGKIVIGNVGRFTFQKNHEFLIDIFREINRLNDDTVLLLAGDGPLENHIKKKVEDFGLTRCTYFLGVRNDIEKLMQAMDVFLFPSRFEGLGIVLIEAQAAGLGCVISDKIPKDVMITDKVRMLSLHDSTVMWAQNTLETAALSRESSPDSIRQSGYSIDCEYKKLEEMYIRMYERNNKI